MKAFIFPGQGVQYSGMGLNMYQKFPLAQELFEKANTILGFQITDIMFEGSSEELKETKVTQPAIFLHSVIMAKVLGSDFDPQMVSGHSLGEFSALVAAGAMSFEDGLTLVSKRALAMQKACELSYSTMAAVLGLEDRVVEGVCESIEGVVPANYNCPGQLVISGAYEAVQRACEVLKDKGAKRALILPVSGGFHSPMMESAREELSKAIKETVINSPICPIYQNVVADKVTDPDEIKGNLILQLTGPVKWTQSTQKMIEDGATKFIELGPGKVLQGLIRKIDRSVTVSGSIFE